MGNFKYLGGGVYKVKTRYTVLSPVPIPGVGDDPVLDIVLLTPADHLDGMAAAQLAALVLINSAFVGEKVLVDLESDLHRPMGHYLLLDRPFIVFHSVGRPTFKTIVKTSTVTIALIPDWGWDWDLESGI